MREALARSDRDFQISETPAQAKKRAAGKGARAPQWRRALLARARRRPGALLAALALAALASGVLVNALFLQTERHPAPLFPRSAAAPAPAPSSEAPRPAPRPAELAQPVAAPPHAPAPVEPAKPRDGIGAWLRGSGAAAGEPNKAVLEAQRALVKLGYALRADGVLGGTTREAIEKFERRNAMPVTGELSAKIRRELAAQARAKTE